jgi:hypothetical protein
MKLFIVMLLLMVNQSIAQTVPFILTATNTDTMTLTVFKVIHFSKNDTLYVSGFKREDIPMDSLSALRYKINLPENDWYMVLYSYPDNTTREMYIQTGPSDKLNTPKILFVDKKSDQVTNLVYHKDTKTYEKGWRSKKDNLMDY